MNVTIHLAHSLAENAVEQSFSTLESGPLVGLQTGSQKIRVFHIFLNKRAPRMLLKIEYKCMPYLI